jgi:D-glycero-beta-D-manno-heptose-7-phosphate kinase
VSDVTDADNRIAQLARPCVLVAGDVVLDEYLYGMPTRLSREAPIPVLELTRRATLPGGAANPAHNITTLGARAILAAVIGDDGEGRQLIEVLRAAGVDPKCVLVDASRPTTVKTRVVCEGLLRFPQQIARIDRISRQMVHEQIVTTLAGLIKTQAPSVDAILCSDYLSGLLTIELAQEIREICSNFGLLFTVDAQGELEKYRGADLLRCNNDEASNFLRRRLQHEQDYETGLAAMIEQLDAGLVVVTRGAQGVSLLGRDVPYTHLPAHAVEVADVTGAGDTFIAVLTLALASGAAPLEAAELANAAAALVVRRVGNAVVTPDELRAALTGGEGNS